MELVRELTIESVISPRGDAAQKIAGLWWVMFGLGTLVALGVFIAIFLGSRRPGAPDRSDTSDATSSSRAWITAGGIALPVVVVTGIFAATIWTMRSTSADAPDGALQIEVTGHQWWWEVDYPADGVITANEIHIPAGEPVEIVLRSADVIHSFWVPALAGKIDALPERTNSLVISADEPGRFQARCAEFCGIQHANMDLFVVAHSPADFAAWIERRAAPARTPTTDSERAGLQLVESNCSSCHRIDGTDAAGETGPDLTHVADRDVIGGGVLQTTAVDLVDWITDPHGAKPGVLMPPSELSAAEIDEIVAYLVSLE